MIRSSVHDLTHRELQIMNPSMRLVLRRCGAITLTIGALILAPSSLAQTNQRPIDDFVSTQGTFCVNNGAGGCLLFVPPDPNFVGWSTVLDPTKLPVVRSRPAIPLFAGVDYAGVADAYAAGKDPVLTGTVTDR